MSEIIRGAVEWSTVSAVDSNGENDFGKIAIYVGGNPTLKKKLKIWELSVNEFSRVEIKMSNTASGGALAAEIPPDASAPMEIEFSQPAEFIVMEAFVAEDQQGHAEFEFAII